MIYLVLVADLVSIAMLTRSAMNKDKVGVAVNGILSIAATFITASHLVG